MLEDRPFDPFGEEPFEVDNDQTRGSEHPDGFTFLQPHSDKFWAIWLQFTSKELEQLGFLRWEYQHQPQRVF